ncbi:GNAT family N-acetyltransferase [uncultured Psychroserpens sp.]|uniref:GNAT family N-acetyltransferase n=1 Tax=uncultured Psychroserpens sp. TaxID=255436 RepID=UPI0026324D72|nr:GNAT family N-acetyltransferase [uncultured Psychroserpens sp.]
MQLNPFTSNTFIAIWTKHFNKSKPPKRFDFISGIQFFKHSFLPLYINIGKNLTKGISYKLCEGAHDYKGKTFLIYDVPTYFNIKTTIPTESSSLRLKKVFQYQGFLMDISSYKDQDEYINAQFSSKNRREFRSNKRRLEACFNIKYSFLHGDIGETQFKAVFNQFNKLLNKRFAGKQVNYHHLSKQKWRYYRELVYTMLLEKNASLLIIYNEKTPIGVTLNFHSESILFETITVFDPDYYKFSVGKTSIIKLLEWCFENNYTISDFSKGDFEYKHKWSNLVYDFHYHILYDSKSLISRTTATLVSQFYKLKLYLRRKGVNERYRRLRYFIQGKKHHQVDDTYAHFKLKNLTNFDELVNEYKAIDYLEDNYKFMPQFVYTFAFANPEPISNIKVYKNKRDNTIYVISGSTKTQQIIFN